MESHKKAVAAVAASVRRFYDRKEPFRIFHGSTNSTRSILFWRGNVVDTSKLSHVLNVDTKRKTALVEPNVPMDRLVETTLKYGLVPPVVMEFPGITVGGGYAGTSGESSSFKHGFFNRTINHVDMILANGDCVAASERERADLFYGAAGAVGSLGVVTAVELQLIEAKKYVETTYHPVHSVSEATQKIRSLTSDTNLDYVDGILFSLNEGVIVTGRMTNDVQKDIPIRQFSGPKDPWFYLHAKDIIVKTKGKSTTTELIPLDEYLFRYDRGGFWVGASAFEYFYMPFNRLTRWFLDEFLHTRQLYTALHASGFSTPYIVQDLALPYSTVEQFIEYTDKAFGIYPLWLCPLRQDILQTFHPHSPETEADGKTLVPMLNIGLWGYGPSNRQAFFKLNRQLETKLQELGGMKWLYANTYYSKSNFWEIYDRQWYDELRTKYHATSLPSVYDKVHTDFEAEEKAVKGSWLLWLWTLWPLAGLRGVHAVIASGQRFLAWKSRWKSIKAKDSVDVN
jgi:Delta24-sterol reductase